MRSFPLRFTTLLLLTFGLAQSGWPQEVITQIKRSPPKASGEGRGYSEWYLLQSDPAPSGYFLSDSQFKLEGSGSCGTNAQCLEGERTRSTSSWLFRIQGQGAGSPGGANVAVLTTKYRKTSAEPTYSVTTRSPERFSSRGEFFGCFDVAKATDVPEGDGPWCSLSAQPPKPGYRIKSASFSLEGDRSCVGNDFDREIEESAAECLLTTRTDTQVTWQFKMLGHTEAPDFNNTAEKSFGQLIAVYEKVQ
jgi:hypothetical protein